MIKSH